MSQRNLFTRRYMIKIDVLLSLLVRVGIIEYPLVARQVGAMPVDRHRGFADHLDAICAILIEIKSIAVGRVPGPGQNMLGIAPDKM